MKIITYEPSFFQNVLNLWNDVASENTFFKKHDALSFQALIFNHANFNPNSAFIAIVENEVVGFCNVVIRVEDETNLSAPGYVTSIFVKREFRKQGIGSKLLNAVENYLITINRTSVRFCFLGGINFPWNIPNTPFHDHPGAPGVVINSPLYFFLLHHKFYVQGLIDAFYLPLSEYQVPEKAKEIKKENAKNGFTIEFYNDKVHHGFDEFCEKIDNNGFALAIYNNLAKPKPNPFLVVSKNNRVVGWTGALYEEPSGRGHFDGIAIIPEYRKKQLGKTLFCELCIKSKELGAKFMSFFTGLDNPARRIYLFAGFKIVQSFAIMKKELT